MFTIRATGTNGASATEPAGTDPNKVKDLVRRATALRDVERTEVLDANGNPIATYPR